MATLAAFLADPVRSKGTFTYHELQGFLFAVICGPELALPSEWMPVLFDDQDPGYQDLEEARAVTGEIMAMYNAINEGAVEGRAALPADCAFRRPAMANFDDEAPVAQWSRGFIRGHSWLEDDWEPFMVDEFEEVISALLVPLSFFASRSFAEEYAKETESKDVGRAAAEMVCLFPDALARYAALGRSFGKIAHRLRAGDGEPPPPEPARSEKVGRNDPCPCGSGKKYKKCHGASV